MSTDHTPRYSCTLVHGFGGVTYADMWLELDGEYVKRNDYPKLREELATLRGAAFAVTAFALPYWSDDHHPKSIPVSDDALLRLQRALYSEEE